MIEDWVLLLTVIVALSQAGRRPPIYSFQVWKDIVGQERLQSVKLPEHIYARPGRLGELLELQTDGGIVPVRTRRQWEQKRLQLRHNFKFLFGRFPERRVPVDLKVLKEEDAGPYVRKTIEFTSEPGERVPGFLLVPKGIQAKAPGIVCPHQTVNCGSREPVGLEGNPDLAYAEHLARRGYVTIACDALCFGGRHAEGANYYGDAVAFYEKHPDWSIAGKYAFDVSRQVDVLQSLPEVAPDRIGCIGHSLGGHTTIYAMAYDRRIKVGVSNCGFTSFRADFAERKLFPYYGITTLLPMLHLFDSEDAIGRLPLDYHEMLALIAPRSFLIIAPLRDDNFAHEGVVETFEAVKPVYDFLGAAGDIQLYSPDCAHEFPPESRKRAYSFIDHYLGGR